METCLMCDQHEQCETPCKDVNDILWKDNRVMERRLGNNIVCYPMRKEVHFSEISEEQRESFTTEDVIPWSSADLKLRKTTVFVERFFNKVSCKELAERFGVKENTIVCMFKQAVEQLEKMIEAMDARKEGLKATRAGKFTDDQKFFLLIQIFGFNGYEVAKIFGLDHRVVSMRVKRMTDRYEAAFKRLEVKEETPVEDPPIKGKLTRADVISMVDAYTEQGLSHRQAFKRMADRYADVVGRPVSFRGVESRYYKATGLSK
ncbi:MAG: hypothetical protein WCO26_10975 [Deltaproteobacteria bacterium]